MLQFTANNNCFNILHTKTDIADITREPTHTTILSKEIQIPFKFDSLVLGATALLPVGASLLIELQVTKDNVSTPWFKAALFEHKGGRSFPGDQTHEIGNMETDIFKAKTYADSYKYRITTAGRASLLNIFSTLTRFGAQFNLEESSQFIAPNQILLDVPKISQIQHGGEIKNRICSPSCLTMLMKFYGYDAQLQDIALQAYDHTADIYGNWLNAIACAGSYGMDARLARFETMQQLYAQLLYGTPVIASILYKKGELKGAHKEKTAGHLVLVKGVDANGNIIVNDPAAKDDNHVETVYDSKEFAKVWLGNKKGLAYLIGRGQ
ncbi:hypothetical protein Dip510_000725 [Elusimicrobium posterum]|uniref:C39 family peptidase n=1 Tax=Elusimicrobium posterum TaxID=3116653 RepID=UPI003C740520